MHPSDSTSIDTDMPESALAPSQPPAAAPPWVVTYRQDAAGRQYIQMADERGRTWSLLMDNAMLKAVLWRYQRLHGLLPTAIHDAFARHGRIDELRLMLLRCGEGEPINLAARALALGPVPPIPAPASWPKERPWVRDVMDRENWEELHTLAAAAAQHPRPARS